MDQNNREVGSEDEKKEEKIKEEENKEINEIEVKEENNIINSNGLKKKKKIKIKMVKYNIFHSLSPLPAKKLLKYKKK